ncbi:MAG TPA: hypothetical protein VGE98_02680 [Thermoanaerobaculia bacterium]
MCPLGAAAALGLLLVLGAPTVGRAQAPTNPPANPPAGQAAPPAGNPQDRVFDDSQYGFTVNFPGNWQQSKTGGVNVPGEVRAVWSPDGTTTIVIFVQKPGKPVNPWIVLDQSADALQKGLNVTLDAHEVRDVGGMKAMWLVINGNGTGAGIDGKGTVPTSQHWVAIPRAQDIIVLLLTTPQGNFSITDPIFQTMLGTLKVTGTQTPEQQVEAHLKPHPAPATPPGTTPPPARTNPPSPPPPPPASATPPPSPKPPAR